MKTKKNNNKKTKRNNKRTIKLSNNKNTKKSDIIKKAIDFAFEPPKRKVQPQVKPIIQ